MKKPLWLVLLLTTLFLWYGTALFPSIHVWAFAPFLATLFHRVPLISALWFSALLGLGMDLFSSEYPFSLFAISHSLCTLILYAQKRHFFEDKPIAFCLFSALISTFLSLILTFCSLFCSNKAPLTLSSFFFDLILMPPVDALYALIWVLVPTTLYSYIRRYLLIRKLSEET